MTATRKRLDNGLTLLTEEIHDAPVVALQAWVHVGSADETDDIAGIAHVHEHMLFKGTARRGVGEIARTVEGCGGEINAWTSFDETVYHLVLPGEELETGLDILSDVLRESAFDAGELSREIEVVLEEVRRAEDIPSRRIAKAIFALAYDRHPYRRPVIGTVETVRALSRERILEFFHEHYRPDRVTLVAAGDFERARVEAEVERLFAGWDARQGSSRPVRPTEPARRGTRVEILSEPVKETRIACAWSIPGLRHEDIPAIDTLSVLLGHGESSRLFLETRRRLELVNDVYAYAYTPMDPGLLMLGAGLRGENLEEALASMLEQTFEMRHTLVGTDELEKAKVIMLSEEAYQRETVQGEARKLGFFEVVGGAFGFEQEYYARLRALTPEDVREVARRYLHDGPSLVVQVPQDGPQPERALLEHQIASHFARAEAPAVRSSVRGALGVTRLELDDGAVVLVRHEDSPVVAVRAVALGGLRWEDRDSHGLGHLFASLWGRSTHGLSVEALAHAVALLGGHISAFAGRNTVGLRGEFLSEKGRDGLEVFTDALLGSVFYPADLERERAVILERIKNREDSPAVVAFDLFASTVYPTHPYGLPAIGSQATVERFSLDDVEAYARRYVTPDKLVVAVVGGIDERHALDMLAGRLGRAGGEPLGRVPPADPAPTAPRAARKHLEKKQAHVIIGSMGTTVDDPRRHALEVLSTILSGQSGRLFLELRDRQSLAYAISSSSLEGLDPGYFLVHVGTSPDKVEQALAGVYDQLARLRDQPPGEEELDRARRFLIGTHAIDLQRCGARAMLMAIGERYGQGYDEHSRYPSQIRAVTAEAVQAAAREYLDPDRLVEVVLGPLES